MIRVFAGYDEREAFGYHVFCSSVIRTCSVPVAFTPVSDDQADGSNTFVYARFKVAELCKFEGWAIFADACDMLCIGDMAELWALRDEKFAVQVVKNSYKTRNPIKYIGTAMQCPNVDYPRKNWSSLQLINCAAPEWQSVTWSRRGQQQFAGFDDDRIGELPAEWNVLVDENGSPEGAKLLHWTAGSPGFWHYRNANGAEAWHAEHEFLRQAYI